MAVLQGDSAVGYIPQESSRVAWYFLRHGREITCEITGRRRRLDVDGKGLEFTHFLGKAKKLQEVATTCEGAY